MNSVDDREADLSARARAWRKTYDPRVLWPTIDPNMLQPAADAIGRAVIARLKGEVTSLGAPDGRDADVIGVAALLTGTGPLLGHWVETGALDVADALAIVLARHLDEGRRRVERITRGVTPALLRLVHAGVTPAVIKGYHTAHVYFAEPGLRPLADVDIVVAPLEIARAEEALRAVGFAPSAQTERPYKRDWYPPDDDARIRSLELFHARDRWTVELHEAADFALLPRYGFRLDVGVQARNVWLANGVPVRTPSQPLLTVILATHLSAELDTRRLLRLVELTYVIRRDRELGRFTWDAFAALLEALAASRFVYPALALIEKLEPGTVDPYVLARCRRASTRLARLVSDRFTPTCPIVPDRPMLAERLMWIATPADVVKRIAQWVNPRPGAPWREVMLIYHSRVRRLLAGRLSWIPRRRSV